MLVVLAGCGSSAEVSATSQEQEITLAYSKWPESVAISHLTKVLLEDELGYDVEMRRVERKKEAFSGVVRKDLDAFQAVWRPHHDEVLSRAGEDVRLLDSWVIGSTRSSLAVPSYMGIRSVEELEGSGVEKALILGPEASALGELPARALARYDLEVEKYPSTAAMLREVDRLYRAEEPFVFVAWSPHWMNNEYKFNYIEDPESTVGDLTRPASIHAIVRRGLDTDDPLAYALIDTLLLTQYQVESLQLAIRNAENPTEGARAWLDAYQDLKETWIRNAKAQAGV